MVNGRDARLYLRRDMQEVESVSLVAGLAVVFSSASPSRGGENEDACAVLPYAEDRAALVVSDGVGGARAGGDAARRTIAALDRSLARGREAGLPLRAAILDGIEAANRAVVQLGGGAAATVSVVAVDGPAIRPYHVGDSAILLVGGLGRLKHQSLSHGPVGYAVEAGLLSEAEAMHHEERHLVSNLLGSADMRIEVGPRIPLAPRDTLLLASDGLIDNLYLEEIAETVRKGKLEAAAARLARAGRERMLAPGQGEPSKEDDLTFVLYRRCRARRPKV